MNINIDRFYCIIRYLREDYEDEWRNVKEQVQSLIKDLREILFEYLEGKLDLNETYERLMNGGRKINDLYKKGIANPKDLFWLSWDIEPTKKFLRELKVEQNRKVLDFLRRLKKIEDALQGEIKQKLINLYDVTKNIRGVKVSQFSSYLCVVNPKIFYIACNACLPRSFLEYLGLSRFWGAQSDIVQYIELLPTLYKVDTELGIQDNLEFLYYISRLYNNEKLLSEIKSECNNMALGEEYDREWLDTLWNKGQVILYGPPGTGKTYHALRVFEEEFDRRGFFLTFHQSYSYEEFVEGYRPVLENGNIVYKVCDGKFKRIVVCALYDLFRTIDHEDLAGLEKYSSLDCLDNDKAYNGIKSVVQGIIDRLHRDRDFYVELKKRYRDNREAIPRYCMVIDEINRGDISRVFGELITLIEMDKRLFQENEVFVKLPYSGEYFTVPPNLYIIGTLNSTDRSIALVDFALRRRFSFIEFTPQLDKIDITVEDLNIKELVKLLNKWITEKLDRDHRIGHSYFLRLKDTNDGEERMKTLEYIWKYEIIPLLNEYFYGEYDKLREIMEPEFVNEYGFKDPSEMPSGKELIKALKNIITKIKGK